MGENSNQTIVCRATTPISHGPLGHWPSGCCWFGPNLGLICTAVHADSNRLCRVGSSSNKAIIDTDVQCNVLLDGAAQKRLRPVSSMRKTGAELSSLNLGWISFGTECRYVLLLFISATKQHDHHGQDNGQRKTTRRQNNQTDDGIVFWEQGQARCGERRAHVKRVPH